VTIAHDRTDPAPRTVSSRAPLARKSTTGPRPKPAPVAAIRILVVHRYVLFRLGIAHVLGTEPGFEIVGDVDDGDGAVKVARATRPDVVILELTRTPSSGAVEISRSIKRQLPAARIIALAASEDQDVLIAALAAGAHALIPREIGAKALIALVRRVASGEDLLTTEILGQPAAAARVITEFRKLALPGEPVVPPLAHLSRREVEILDHVAQAQTNEQIAAALSISVQTVKNHMTTIMSKLSLHHREHAVAVARRNGWISDPNE
jgi:DNA-binding NarL/FixJ family response regulator